MSRQSDLIHLIETRKLNPASSISLADQAKIIINLFEKDEKKECEKYYKRISIKYPIEQIKLMKHK